MASGSLVAVQAVAAAVSALTAVYLGRVTIRRDRDARSERERDLRHEQRRRLLDGLRAVREVLADRDAQAQDFDIARAEVAAALVLRPIALPACEALLADEVPKPPYNMGEDRPWTLLDAALTEVRAHLLSTSHS